MALRAFRSVDLAPEWSNAIPRRLSSRRFDGAPLDAALLDHVENTCRRLEAAATGGRPVLLRNAPPEVFTGLIGSYGRIEGAPSAIAFIGSEERACEVGYIGEATILDAASAGLNTCWIAAAFDAEKVGGLVDLGRDERVHAISALGIAVNKIGVSERLTRSTLRAGSRLPLDKIAPGTDGWPAWAKSAAAAVRLAPSGANRQPWRMHMEDDALVIDTVPNAYWTVQIDLGIAMLHAELGAADAGVHGTWAVGSDSAVARFVPATTS